MARTPFYYRCPECGSRLVQPNKDHTIMKCLKCELEWTNAAQIPELPPSDEGELLEME